MTIPETPLTDHLRHLWRAKQEALAETSAPDDQTFEDFYADACSHLGGTPNSRALAAILFDRALRHWPDFFRPTDIPAIHAWGYAIDYRIPLATPDEIELAVDLVATSGQYPGGPASFLTAVEQITKGETN